MRRATAAYGRMHWPYEEAILKCLTENALLERDKAVLKPKLSKVYAREMVADHVKNDRYTQLVEILRPEHGRTSAAVSIESKRTCLRNYSTV